MIHWDTFIERTTDLKHIAIKIQKTKNNSIKIVGKHTEMWIFTSLSRVSRVTITKAIKRDYFISVFCFLFHNSEENVKIMQYC